MIKKITILKTLRIYLMFFIPLTAFSHGEDKLGPHGGYIRMPGAFHTEVLKDQNGYKVYLLDMNWKNPSVLNSSVKASILFNSKKTDLSCTQIKGDNFYICKTQLPETGQLMITAKREGLAGSDAIYNLPLKLESPSTKSQNTEHHGHH